MKVFKQNEDHEKSAVVGEFHNYTEIFAMQKFRYIAKFLYVAKFCYIEKFHYVAKICTYCPLPYKTKVYIKFIYI